MQPRWKDPMKTAEGELLQHVLQLESIVKAKKDKEQDKEQDNEQIFADIMGDGDKDKAHQNYEQAREMDREGKFNKKPSGDKMSKYGMSKGMCKGAMCKMGCKDDPTCGTGLNKGGLYMGDMNEKNKYCQEKFGKNYSECSPSQKAQCDKHCGDMKKGDYMFKVSMDEKNKYCQKHFGKDYSECSPSQKAQCDRNCGKGVKKGNYMLNEELENPKLADRDKDGKLSSWEKTVGKKIEQSKKGKETGDYKSDRGNKKIPFKEETKKPVKKEDFTSRFIAQKTGADLVKYEQESISDNGVPQFVDHYGIRGVNYQTNGRIPHFEQNAQNINAISEKAKMPAFAKTGYDAKGSSLHMQLIDGGDRADGNWNIAPIEERLTELKKGATNPGLVDEIANLMESIANRL